MTPLFTVFTPTYNRAGTIHRVYESLTVQTLRDFEWLIIDDGSADGTSELVAQWQKEADFAIRYYYQENSGKHVAHNRAVDLAQGELLLPLDSDDVCLPNALERLLFHWRTIPEVERSGYSGVTGLCVDQNGVLIGDPFPVSPLDSTPLDVVVRQRIRGEKWGFTRIDVLREFPSPVPVRASSHVPEGIMWNRIGRRYKTRFVNEVFRIYFRDDSANALTRRSGLSGARLQRMASGQVAYQRYALNEELDYFGDNPADYLRKSLNYVRFSLHSGEGYGTQVRHLKPLGAKALWGMGLLPGTAAYVRDIMPNNNKQPGVGAATRAGATQEEFAADHNRFGFGENWARFLAVLNEERIGNAVASLQRALGRDRLDGLRFLDAGSGSGLFSLAAKRLGAESVHSFDYDPQSVACTRELKRRYFPGDESWKVEQASVLDENYLRSLGKFDIVYSWGVLHHTGAMWKALDLITLPVKPGGQLYIAIYNDQRMQSSVWKAVKRLYNRLPHTLRKPYVLGFVAIMEPVGLGLAVVRGDIPSYLAKWRGDGTARGMSRWYDYVDWIGGYPFEVATPDAIFNFYRSRGYDLTHLKTVGGRLGCNEFVFKLVEASDGEGS